MDGIPLPGCQLDYELEPNPESREKGEPLGKSSGQPAAPTLSPKHLSRGLPASCLLEQRKPVQHALFRPPSLNCISKYRGNLGTRNLQTISRASECSVPFSPNLSTPQGMLLISKSPLPTPAQNPTSKLLTEGCLGRNPREPHTTTEC